MGKSYRNDAKNDRWRKAKQQKHQKSWKNKPRQDDSPKSYSPFDDSPEHHESFV